MGHITDLPQELYKSITKHLKTKNIISLSGTCRTLFEAIRKDNNGIWETLDLRDDINYIGTCLHTAVVEFLCNILTNESRKSIKHINLSECYDTHVREMSFHNYERKTNINYWHMLVKTFCPNLISVTYYMKSYRYKNPPRPYSITIGYNMVDPLFNRIGNNNNNMEYDLYISKCKYCYRYVCNTYNSEFICYAHKKLYLVE